jgi:hypothetical protein
MMGKKIKAFIEGGNPSKVNGKPYYSVYVDLADDTLNYFIMGDGYSPEEAAADFLMCYQEMKAHFAREGEYFEEAFFEFVKDYASPYPLELPEYILQNKLKGSTAGEGGRFLPSGRGLLRREGGEVPAFAGMTSGGRG